VVLVQGW